MATDQPPDTERRIVTIPDGRKIDVLMAGPADGLPLVLHEGTPVGLVLYPPTVRAAQARGLRVILAARPGYEGSTPRPGRRVVDVADQAALTGAFADYVAAALRASMNTGIAGWRDDDLAFVKDWGFPLDPAPGTPAAPVAIWQGDQDKMVPFGHGQWLAASIPGARAHLLPGEGHLSLTISSLDRILDDLLDLADLKH